MASITLRRLSFLRFGLSGPYEIAGTTSNIGTPNTSVRRRVRLHDQATGYLLREVWSNAADGAYTFTGLSRGTYFVTAFDHTGAYGGVIETDIVLPVP
jgi:hypothetical protein